MEDKVFLCSPYKEIWLLSLDEIELKIVKLRKKAVSLYLNNKAFLTNVLDDVELHEIVYFAKKFDLSLQEAVQYRLISDLDIDLLDTYRGYS